MPRTLDLGNTRLQWLPGTGSLTTPAAPKVSDLGTTGSRDLSPVAVQGSTTIGPTSSDTVSEKSFTDTANISVPTVQNYEGSLVLFRDLDEAGLPVDGDPLALFSNAGIVGWLIRRVGPPSGAAFSVGQTVDAFLVMTDTPVTTGGGGEGFLKVTVPVLAQGSMYLNRKLVA